MPSNALRERIRRRLSEQRDLVTSLLALRQQLQGSLFVRYGVCGKPGCACRTGRGHGPYYVLSRRSGGRGEFAYLEPDDASEAREMVARYRAFRSGLKRLQRLNEELVDLLRRYQDRSTRQARRRLGLPTTTAE